MFTPGFLEAVSATLAAVGVLFAYALLQIRERQRQNAEIEAEQRIAEAARTAAE